MPGLPSLRCIMQDPSDPLPAHPEDADVPEGADLVAFRLEAADKLREAGNALFKQVRAVGSAALTGVAGRSSAGLKSGPSTSPTAAGSLCRCVAVRPSAAHARRAMQGAWRPAAEKYGKAIRYLAPDSFEPEDEAEPDRAKQMAEATVPALLNRLAPPGPSCMS